MNNDFMTNLYAPFLELPGTPRSGPPDDALIIGEDPITHEPRWLSALELLLGTLVLGGSGKGKSNFLRVLVWRLVLRKLRYNEGFIIFDPHGTLSRWVLKLIAVLAPWLAPEVYYLDFKQERGKALQLGLLSGTKDHAYYGACLSTEGILKGFGSSSSFDKPSTMRTLQNACQALLECGLSFNDIRYFLQRGPTERAILATFLDKFSSPVRGFFEDLDAKPASTQDVYAVGALNRTDLLTRTHAIARTQAHIGVDLVPLIQQGSIGIFNGEISGTSVTADARNMFLAMLANRTIAAFEQLPPDRTRPFTILCDEWADYVGNSFARGLSTLRKFGGRSVLVSQRLEDLVLKDGDMSLLRAGLAIPTKVCLGSLPFSECQTMAEEMFLRAIDVDRIKHQVEHVCWDPVMKKVILRGRSRGGSTTDTTAEATTTGRNHQDSHSRGRSAGGRNGNGPENWSDTDTDATSDAENESRASSRSFADTNSWSESEQEAWANFPKKRIEKGTPVFSSIEEQVWTFAKKMKLQPRGVGILSRESELPYDVAFPHMRDFEFDDDAIEPFLDMVMNKPECRPCDELDRQLEDRPRQLLEATAPQPVIDTEEQVQVPTRRHSRRRR